MIYLLRSINSGETARQHAPDDLACWQPLGRPEVRNDDAGREKHDHVSNTIECQNSQLRYRRGLILEVCCKVVKLVPVELQILLHARYICIILNHLISENSTQY